MNVLIVDDQSYVVEGIHAGVCWEHLGIGQVFMAYSGGRAMEILKEHSVDILITDIEMPYISGIDLAEWATHYRPNLAVLFLTAHADFEYAQKAVRIGYYDYIIQPVDYKKLEESIGRVAERLQKARNLTDMYDRGIKWECMKKELHEHFWHKVIFKVESLSFVELEEEAARIELAPKWEASYELVMIIVANQVQSLRHFREYSANSRLGVLTREILEDKCTVLYRTAMDEVTTVYLIESCRPTKLLETLMSRSEKECQCRLACYLSEPGGILDLQQRWRSLEHMKTIEGWKRGGLFLQKAESGNENNDNLIRRIKDYIDANIDRELSRQEIADNVFMSKDYISHQFSKIEGIALIDYINQQKIRRAKALLLETNIPVTMVALKVGISNYSYFCKLFKKLVGMNASEFRGQRK